jgi:hypothetical protein
MRLIALSAYVAVFSASAALALTPGAPPVKAVTGPAATAATAQPATGVSMKKLANHYVEGPGYVTFFHQQTKGYGGTYGECEKNCLADARCKMIEFYKPLRKCHLYDHVKWSGKSRDADTALKEGGN